MQAYTQPGVILAPLIMGQDGTTIDGNSRRSLIPVYLTSANIRAAIRNLPKARVLVGYLPKYSKNDKPRHMSDENWKEVKRVMYKTAMHGSNIPAIARSRENWSAHAIEMPLRGHACQDGGAVPHVLHLR